MLHCLLQALPPCTLLLSFLLFIHSTNATTWDTEFDSTQSVLAYNFVQYGLLKNATMDLYMQASDPDSSLYVLICTDEEHFLVHEDIGICDRLHVYKAKPCIVTQQFYHTVRLYYHFPEFGDYSFYLVHCEQPVDITIKLHLSLLNPGDNNLQSSLIPAPTMFVLMAALWAIVFLIWVVISAPQWKNMTAIHYILLTYPVCKVVLCAYSAEYFHSYQVAGDLTLTSWILYRVFVIVALLDFHFILLLLSKAWSISGVLEKSDVHLIFSMLVGLCCSLMFKYLYEEQASELLASLAYIGLRVMILACIFININHTISRFESEMLNYNIDAEQMENRRVIVKLHKVFILFKFSLMLWVILNVAEFFCNILFFTQQDQNWVDMMNTEFIDLLLGICLGVLLLPNISLQPLFDPSLNENGEHELTTFRSSLNHSHSSRALVTQSGSPNNGESDEESEVTNEPNNRASPITSSSSGSNDEIEISNEEEYDDEVELVDKRKRRIHV